MTKYCPISFADSPRCCDNKCVLYQNGCLIEQALTVYIEEHKPITVVPPEHYSFEDIMNMVESYSPKTIAP